MSYKDDIGVDLYNLTEELIRQPQLYVSYAKKAVRAAIEAKRAKREYELVRADYENRIRNNPSKYDLPQKPREGSVKITAEKMPKVKRMYKRYMKALNRSLILDKIEWGFQQRKGMLEAIANKQSNMYHAEPNLNKSNKFKRSMNRRKLKRRKK